MALFLSPKRKLLRLTVSNSPRRAGLLAYESSAIEDDSTPIPVRNLESLLKVEKRFNSKKNMFLLTPVSVFAKTVFIDVTTAEILKLRAS
ncbi:hypothetical protein OGATHE_001453 [Ogataea polymorpha]|uniref:Uncharacterized protein n=1 Tax=Ogataea polymorpha TaxID=460523 RepID=A0A9P8PRA0_9ASCO|nr:hypothetical protein OGATHE_001453 [Ogataea polymorpha]